MLNGIDRIRAPKVSQETHEIGESRFRYGWLLRRVREGVDGRWGAVGPSMVIPHGEEPFHVIAMVHQVFFHLQIPATCGLQWLGSNETSHDCACKWIAFLLSYFGDGPEAGPVRIEVSRRRVSH